MWVRQSQGWIRISMIHAHDERNNISPPHPVCFILSLFPSFLTPPPPQKTSHLALPLFAFVSLGGSCGWWEQRTFGIAPGRSQQEGSVIGCGFVIPLPSSPSSLRRMEGENRGVRVCSGIMSVSTLLFGNYYSSWLSHFSLFPPLPLPLDFMSTSWLGSCIQISPCSFLGSFVSPCEMAGFCKRSFYHALLRLSLEGLGSYLFPRIFFFHANLPFPYLFLCWGGFFFGLFFFFFSKNRFTKSTFLSVSFVFIWFFKKPACSALGPCAPQTPLFDDSCSRILLTLAHRQQKYSISNHKDR